MSRARQFSPICQILSEAIPVGGASVAPSNLNLKFVAEILFDAEAESLDSVEDFVGGLDPFAGLLVLVVHAWRGLLRS